MCKFLVAKVYTALASHLHSARLQVMQYTLNAMTLADFTLLRDKEIFRG